MESCVDIFKVAIGPSSSRTVGPMRAAFNFISQLKQQEILPLTRKIEVELYGALSLSRKCHNVDVAIYLGLLGHQPDDVDLRQQMEAIKRAEQNGILLLSPSVAVTVTILANQQPHAGHPYAMTFRARDDYFTLYEETWFSTGAGQVRKPGASTPETAAQENVSPFAFQHAAQLQDLCQRNGLSVAALMMKNELQVHSQVALHDYFAHVWVIMQQAVHRGLHTEGLLPGPYQVPRRACALHKSLVMRPSANDFLTNLNWVNAFAIAVSEENAAGGRVVTAPTNGASGIIPAVLSWYDKFVCELDNASVTRFFLTAGAIALLFKQNASILGSEVGCQGEIGVASSMAAAGLAELMGASVSQVLSAAEIAMEHHLGLTCDPVGGQVQIPCVERNAISSVKAINAATMAISRISEPCVSLDEVIAAMYETGKDMSAKYRETYHGCLGKIQPRKRRGWHEISHHE
ncbi:L-serine ammonia-lyase [Citrobacter sp. EC_71]|uniref:L-serine ammonia-lyase n=1 Tax=unclassified Citrobacter TaxID=2644389 RepID=UPI0010C9E8B3|nr:MULTISPECIES: L-serine ammonia-lyase [unclassified Citrobacter]MBW9351527.1 L-serine ammonia-lyase [Citrobacter sp. EC_71]TKU01295.1 L-serine ammonia-lyase [Citrobacter sp. wls830]TKV09410.1 L-serine ammonia-lyase [Citrobacter sp. wls615]